MIDYSIVLRSIRPGSQWSLGDCFDYSSLDWHDHSEPPTLNECHDKWEDIHYEHLMSSIRVTRNHLLDISDWTQISDSSVDAKAWRSYRQALRDLPATIADPTQPIEWPEPPK
jgi:hypothetical protein